MSSSPQPPHSGADSQQVIRIDVKRLIPLATLVSIVVTALMWFGTAAATRGVEKDRIERLEAAHDGEVEAARQLDLRTTKLEAAIAAIADNVREIKGDMHEVKQDVKMLSNRK